jgi:hypothetical protein
MIYERGCLVAILSAKGELSYGEGVPAWLAVRKRLSLQVSVFIIRSGEHCQCVSPETDMTRSFEKMQIRRPPERSAAIRAGQTRGGS